jgi:hypothetical protein
VGGCTRFARPPPPPLVTGGLDLGAQAASSPVAGGRSESWAVVVVM